MASELKVDKFTGITTADVIQVTTGSVTTSLQDGMAKAYSHFSLTSSSEGFKGTNSLNNSSFTDSSTGKCFVTLTNAFADANFALVVVSNSQRSNSALNADNIGIDTDKNGLVVRNDAGTYGDFDNGCAISHGDLA